MPIFGHLGRRHSRKPSKDKPEKDKEPSQSRESIEKEKEKEKPQTPSKAAAPKHHRTKTAPEAPTLSRLPSSSSTARSRRDTNPQTPTATAPSAVASPAYFSPQAGASGAEPRSPPTRRPPASFSAGHDTSRGPPVTLITRGNSDYARRSSQKPQDFAYAQQQFQQLGLVSPTGGTSSTGRPGKDDAENSSEAAPRPQQTQLKRPPQPRHKSTSALPPPPPPMASSSEEEESSSSSDEESPPPSRFEDRRTAQSGHGATDTSGTDEDKNEDLFLHIAEDSAQKQRQSESALRHDKFRSRVARINRMSSPSALQSPSPLPSNSTTPTASRIPSSAEQRTTVQPRRVSHLPTSSRTVQERVQERPPQSPASPFETPRSRPPDLNTKASFSRRDSELSPRDFLAQFGTAKRRGSQPETLQTPPNRTAYRPSNLGHYSSSRDDTRSPPIEAPQPAPSSHADGTESHGSTGPAVSVWDELDELKTRIRRIEMGGKIPATSGAIISQATAERPRTANTSATTVSSSPNQPRKTGPSPSESTVDAHTSNGNNRIHPLLREALFKTRQVAPPTVYRTLESVASEAMSLAELTGSAGPQGTLHSASSILGGASVSDRQVRRKADNICRSLTELCIALCDTKPSLSSPAIRNSTATISRRPSVQINGDSPTVRQSIEPESNTLSNISPSRALHRIEARRTSMLVNGNKSTRELSQDHSEYDRENPSRLQRAGTSLYRSRHNSMDDDEEEPTMRAPSRAMTDFRSLRGPEKSRLTARQYTSREPMPELQPAPSLQSAASLRRPTVSTGHSLLYRDESRRYDFQRESSPAIERQQAGSTLRARQQLAVNRNQNRNSIGGISDLSRSVSMGRGRLRGNSTGE